MVSKHDVLETIPEGHANRIASTEIADRVGNKPTNVRDTIQELREEGFAIGGGQGLGGYWIIQTHDGLQRVLKNIERNIETQEERKQLILEACEAPPVDHEPVEDPPEPNIPDGVRNAVDALVDDRGVEAAEQDLQRRYRERDDTDRTLQALSYLRAHYRSGQLAARAGP